MPFLFKKDVLILTFSLMVGVGKGRMLTYLLAHFFLVVQLLREHVCPSLGVNFSRNKKGMVTRSNQNSGGMRGKAHSGPHAN